MLCLFSASVKEVYLLGFSSLAVHNPTVLHVGVHMFVHSQLLYVRGAFEVEDPPVDHLSNASKVLLFFLYLLRSEILKHIFLYIAIATLHRLLRDVQLLLV